ncbi:MAG: hypothetical protein IJZ37_00975 [Clostridia bacterium]|nr:hypothetical protein [Clostridia bacterium]
MEKSTLKGMKFSKEKLQNIWFYYKWHIVIGIAVLLVGAALITQCASKEDHDVYIYYAGGAYFSPEKQDQMEDAFEVVIPDDLAKSVGFFYTRLGKIQNITEEEGQEGAIPEEELQQGTDHQAEYDAQMDFTSRMHQQATVICLLDEKYFEGAVKEGWLAPLSSVMEDVPENAVKGYGIPVGELPFYKSNSVFKNISPNALLCFTVEAPVLVRTGDSYENQKTIFARLVNYEKEE